jgi:hypothetical protein
MATLRPPIVASADRPDDGLRQAAAAALDRLGLATARRRGRADRRIAAAVRRLDDARDALAAAGAAVARAVDEELAARGRAARGNAADPEDSAGRGLSTLAYGLLLVVLWALNLPVATATFQVFGESLAFTVLLALVADVVFLSVAHAAGVTLRRAQLAHDAVLVLGVELLLGWALFLLGMASSLASGWVRWRYLQLTGTGSGPEGVVFTTILTLASFLLATLAALRHHHPAGAVAQRATRRRRMAERRAAATQRAVRRTTARCANRMTRRRVLAQRVVAQADRHIRKVRIMAVRSGRAMTVDEPPWLAYERQLGHTPAGASRYSHWASTTDDPAGDPGQADTTDRAAS